MEFPCETAVISAQVRGRGLLSGLFVALLDALFAPEQSLITVSFSKSGAPFWQPARRDRVFGVFCFTDYCVF